MHSFLLFRFYSLPLSLTPTTKRQPNDKRRASFLKIETWASNERWETEAGDWDKRESGLVKSQEGWMPVQGRGPRQSI